MQIEKINYSALIRRRGTLVVFMKKGGVRLSITNACASPHAGGAGRAAALDNSVGSADSAGVVASTNGDDGDDGDGGDGDPDSDRRQLSCLPRTSPPAPFQSATSKRILRMPAVQVRIGLSRSTIYEAINKGEFPPSISLGARAVGWLESDIDAWLESRVLASKTVSVIEFKPAQVQSARIQSANPSKR